MYSSDQEEYTRAALNSKLNFFIQALMNSSKFRLVRFFFVIKRIANINENMETSPQPLNALQYSL